MSSQIQIKKEFQGIEDETKITLVQLYATYIRRIDFDIFVKLAIKIFGNFLLIHMVKVEHNIGFPKIRPE